MAYLLDINVLIALFDPQHIHHIQAHSWFAQHSKKGWATCPIIENGFVRIVNSQSYPNRQPSIWYTLGLLSKAKDEFTNYYEFWPDEVSLTDQNIFRHKFIIGHKMITDVYLLGLCKKRGGKLATFDGRVSPDLIEGGSAELVELIG